MLNLAMLLDDAARKYPSREAVVAGTERLTYAELDARARRVANVLRSLGLRPGDRVALTCPNVAWFPVAYYGVLRAGCVVVPLNTLLKPEEIAYHLRDSGARAYLCHEGLEDGELARTGNDAIRQVPGCEHFIVLNGATPASSVEFGPAMAELMESQPADGVTADRAPDDTAVILYTSGTTGRPKGAELTHANMLSNAMVARGLDARLLDPAAVSVSLVALPLFHSFGQTSQMNAGVYGAGTLVLVPRFDPAIVLELMARERVSLFAGVPTMYWRLLQYVRQHGVDPRPAAAHLVLCNSGGAVMSEALRRDFEETFGVTVLEGYGLSETAPVVSFTYPDLPRKPGSVGLPVFGTEVRIVDEAGNEVPRNQPGEIVVRGMNVMKGYINQPEATAEAFRDGWFRTGDIGRMDEDGYLYIVDRLKDMVIRGGFNVYPREVEEVLHRHPAISLAAVVGTPDEELGEEVKAYVVLKPGARLTEPELIAWCRERMASYKVPRIVEFRESLPLTATGKVLKRALTGN